MFVKVMSERKNGGVAAEGTGGKNQGPTTVAD